MMYRYTTTSGEGTFSATRQFLDQESARIVSSIVELLHKKADWLVLPHIPEQNLEFYFTEKGRELFEACLREVQEVCLGDIHLKTVSYEELSGSVLYEDPYQVAIRSPREEGSVPDPYQNRTQYCF